MAIYVGEGVTIICVAKNPVTGAVISNATASLDFFAPGKNPAKVPADRTVDEGPVAMSYDATIVNTDGTTGAYIAFVDTTGWAAGKWAYRVTIESAYESWEFGTFKLGA